MIESSHIGIRPASPRAATRAFRRRLQQVHAWVAGLAFSSALAASLTGWPASGESKWLRMLFIAMCIGVFSLAVVPITGRLFIIALRRARDAETRFRAAFDQATVGLVRLTPAGVVVAINRQFGQTLRRTGPSLAGMQFEKLFLDSFSFDALTSLGESVESRMLRGDGQHFWARLTATAACCGEVFVAVEDVSETRTLRDTLSRHATHDSLTDLVNRREIERRLEAVLANTQQTDVRHTLCFLDIDEFKLINDVCSHAAGDKVLRMVATALSNELDPPGWVGRLGGDEFVALFEFVPLDSGLAMATNLNRVVAETALVWGDRRFPLTASVGVVEINRDTPTVAWLLRAADTACYLAKASGRNRVRPYEESDREIARRRGEIEWASKIRNAVAESRLLLYAQRIEPLNPAQRNNGMQCEVLVRLQDESGDIVLPGAFLSAAEHFSMASIVDRKVLTNTVEFLCRQPAHLEQLELCHVNLSGQSVTSMDFRLFTVAILESRPEVATKLCFELTETASVDNAKANEFIAAVRKLGCQIALDDFGNGLSSFAYLKNLPVDIVKIDSIFVRDIDTDVLDLAVVRSITEVCRSLGKRVVAEGVESTEVMERLRVIGVDAAQGFAIHRPSPIEELFSPVPATMRAAPKVDAPRHSIV
jgi:diguanylate cyclase (GGDEF)-like protein